MKKQLVMVAAISGVMFTSCHKNEDKLGFASNEAIFRTSVFKAELEKKLNGALGYALVINQKGQMKESAADGMGTSSLLGGANNVASINYDVNIASVTKAFTAMAVIKKMNQKGILMNFPIGPWLPNSWSKHANISAITFKELLTHTSGIRESGTSWTKLKDVVANNLEGGKTYAYSNVNFALFRALLPKMHDAAFFNQKEQNLSTIEFDKWMSTCYLSLMQTLVFTPAGVPNAICKPSDDRVAMQAFNELSNPPLLPKNPGDWTETCAGGGYYLTTVEMAKVMAYLAHTQSILTNSQKTTMDDNLYGWDSGDSFMTTRGRVFGKDGALYWDNNGNSTADTGDSGLQTWVGKFPNGVELALSINSLGNGYRSLSTIVKQAYEAAWSE